MVGIALLVSYSIQVGQQGHTQMIFYGTVAFVYLTGMVGFGFLADQIITNIRRRNPVRVAAAFLLWPLVIIAMAVGPLFMKD